MSEVMNLGEVFDYAMETKMDSIKFRHLVWELRTRLSRLASEGSGDAKLQNTFSLLIEDQHIPVLMALENAYWKLGIKAQEMMNDFMMYMNETKEDAVFDYLVIQEIEGQLFVENDAFLDLSDKIRLIYRSIADDMDVPLEMPSNLHYEKHHTSALRTIRETLAGIENFTFDLGEIEELLGEVRYFIRKIKDAQDQLLGVASPKRLAIMDGAHFDFGEFSKKAISDSGRFIEEEAGNLDEFAASLRGLLPIEMIYHLPESAMLAEWEVFTQIIEGCHCDVEVNVAKFVQSLTDTDFQAVENDLSEDLCLPFSVVRAKWWSYDLQIYDEIGW